MCTDSLHCDTSTGTPWAYILEQSNVPSSTPHMDYRILYQSHFKSVSSGLERIQMYVDSLIPVSSVKRWRYIDTLLRLQIPSVHLMQDVSCALLTLLDLYQHYKTVLISSHMLIGWLACPIPDITAYTVEQAVISGWISCFVVHSTIITD